MKPKSLIIFLFLVSLVLGAGWFYRHRTAVKEKAADTITILNFSNDLVQTSAKLEDQRKVNYTLERDLEAQAEEMSRLSNSWVTVSGQLQKTEQAAKVAAQTAQAEIAKRDAKIAALESERDDLTTRMNTLNTSITDLQAKISETQKKLAASEGDREFLLDELKRLQSEKADLERQFNNLAALREQVSKLRAELSIARRLEWIRQGLYGRSMKGAERLQKGFPAAKPKQNYDLDVEVRQDGTANVVPSSTNEVPANASGTK